MSISVITPITPAWNHMVRILFKPFVFNKWLALGFCAFLAQCGEQGSGGGSNFMSPPGNSNTIGEEGKVWINANFDLFLAILCIGIILFICIGLLVTWISSRGKFMLIDGIVKNRCAISEPWTEYKTEGNSLFFFSIAVGLVGFFGFCLIGGLSALIALPDFQSDTFGNASVIAIVIGSIFLIIYILICIAVAFFIKVLMVPTMYLKRVRAIEGWKIAWKQLFKNNVGASVLLLLMMLLLGLGASTVTMLAICATCCLVIIPYVGSVILLPIAVFFTCYALCYIQQFGEEWMFFKNTCSNCCYDLRSLNSGTPCPECGHAADT